MEINIKIEAPALVDAINALAVAIAGDEEPKAPIPFTITEEPEKPNADITIDHIRKAFIEKNKDRTNTPKLKALLADYGVEKVTDLPEQHFAEILEKLKEI